MFTKIKNKIRNKLMDWLGITELDKSTAQFLRRLDREVQHEKWRVDNTVSDLRDSLREDSKAIKTLHETIQNVVHIGTDVNPHAHYGNGRSWAVICIEGKMNIVKFVDLDRGNTLEILHFLKQFEAGRHCIDAPYQEMFYNELFKF